MVRCPDTSAAKRLASEILPLSDANRTNTDLVHIYEAKRQMTKAMDNDAGAWRHEWDKDGQRLLFPRYLRDQKLMSEGVVCGGEGLLGEKCQKLDVVQRKKGQ
jgi:hypothetical protein